jgi:hypothetical protein
MAPAFRPWPLLDQAEQERLIASGAVEVEQCRGCGAVLEVWQREDADARNDWEGVPPPLLALFSRNPADWRVIAVFRGSTCPAGGDHTQRRSAAAPEPERAYATLIAMSDATFPWHRFPWHHGRGGKTHG